MAERSRRPVGSGKRVASPGAASPGRAAAPRDRCPPGGRETPGGDAGRQEALEALRVSEARFRELADSISDPFYALDEGLRCTYLNPAAARLLGVAAKDAIGKPPEELSPDPTITARAVPVLRRVLRTRKPGTYITAWPTPEGRLFLEAKVYPSRSGLSVFGRDITVRVQREAERERLILELAQAREQAEERAIEAEEAGRRLAEAMQELERTNRELDQFAVIVAHDLREPLRAMSGFSQLVGAHCRERLDVMSREYLAHITDGAARMQQLLDDLLEYSHVDQRRRRLAATDLNRVLDKALANLASLVEQTAPVITRERLPTVTADETQMVHLLQNLLANAMKFRRGEHPRIHVAAESREGEVVASVRDDGIGIEPRHFERIFQIFKRLHGRSGPEGTGVGLAICKKIVEHHRGRIWLESQPGSGSIFFFALPKS